MSLLQEKLSIYPAKAIAGVEILDAHHCSQAWHVFHERYDICACRSAAALWAYRGRMHEFGDQTVGLIEPGEVHRNTRVHKPADFKVVMIDSGVVAAAAEELGSTRHPHLRTVLSTDARLFEAVYAFCDSVESAQTELEQQTRFAALVSRVLACAERPARVASAVDPVAVRRARSYLLERYAEPVTLAELAAVSGVSRFHLVRAFTRRIGLPPHAFQVHVRIERARAFLDEGWLPVQAAAAVGFADQSHMTRHFKRVWGVTPSAYARRARLTLA